MTHALLLALLLHAAPDAPLAPVRPAIVVREGDVVPFAGVCLDDAAAVATGKRLASAEAQVAALEGKTVLSTPVLVGGVVALVAVIAGVAAASYAAGKAR